LDVYLANAIPEVPSRMFIKKIVEAGQVTVNDRLEKVKYKVNAGDRIEADIDDEAFAPKDIPAQKMDLDVFYEDEDLVVINKPEGLTVHPASGSQRGTLVNGLMYRYQELSDINGPVRPGIVHRLDKMTSGLVIVAKNDAAHRRLSEMFKSREVHKTYVALVHGRMTADTGEVSKQVGRDPRRRTRMKAGGIAARDALTKFRVLRRIGPFTLVEAMPQTGRTHQIRVHLASLGHPVVGDDTYGAPAKLRFGTLEEATLSRTFLHAARLAFAHPITGAPMKFEAPLPAELTAFLAHVETHHR